jgi:hypothetical protein
MHLSRLILVSVLHFFTAEDQVRRIVEPLTDTLPSGSYVVASHATAEFAPAAVEAGRAYTRGGVDVIGRDADVFADLVFRGRTWYSASSLWGCRSPGRLVLCWPGCCWECHGARL